MRRLLVVGSLGYLTVVVGALYLAVVAAIAGPIDWTAWAQLVLLFAPFGTAFALIPEVPYS